MLFIYVIYISVCVKVNVFSNSTYLFIADINNYDLIFLKNISVHQDRDYTLLDQTVALRIIVHLNIC